MSRKRASAATLIPSLALAIALAASVSRASADDAATAKGERIYENYCATCHGEQLQNNSAGLTFDLRRLKPDEHARFIDSVLNGKNKMPPWKGVLAEGEIEQLWAYIRANAAR
jgi:mono/diheme cytochrome c family protein